MSSIQHIRLSELNGILAAVIKDRFALQRFWVVADVTSHSYKAETKIHYFELVEKDPHSRDFIAKIAGKAWGTGSMHISDFEKNTGQQFTNNINVLVQVAVEYHAVYGLSVNVLDIDTNFTLGLLQQQREATLLRLVTANTFISKSGDGYRTRNNALQLHLVVQKIALISSSNSAGSEDFRHTLEHNPFGYAFRVDDYFAIVQGENNYKQFLAKLIEIYTSGIAYDAVVITRGGGAQIDFLIFDNYYIAQAVAKFPIPIITGIGHQKNVSIADLMAHTATKTPTKAAEFIIAHNRGFEERLLQAQKTIVIKSQQLFSVEFQQLSYLNHSILNGTHKVINLQKDRLAAAKQALVNTTKTVLYNRKNTLVGISAKIVSRPSIVLYNRINDLKTITSNLTTFNGQYLKNKKGQLGHHASLVKMMAPENILKKGYAIVKINDKIISNADGIAIGDTIDVLLGDSELKTTVQQKINYNGSNPDL